MAPEFIIKIHFTVIGISESGHGFTSLAFTVKIETLKNIRVE